MRDAEGPLNQSQMSETTTVRLILGDQLNSRHSWFQEMNPEVLYLIAEMRQETDYVRHHIQKVVAFFMSMRNFANELEAKGHSVRYIQLDDELASKGLKYIIRAIMEESCASQFEYILPDEYRLDVQLREICRELDIQTHVVDSEHFLTSRDELKSFFKGKKQYLMESFYRKMREKTGWLMDEVGSPLGGKWNFDKENRKKIPLDHDVPKPLLFSRNVTGIVKLLEEQGVQTIGNIDADNFIWPVSRAESLQLLDYFCDHLLKNFGRFQDAMHPDHWSLYHSRLSYSLNVKMISPREVIERAISAWDEAGSAIDIAQIEGFVRQIAGWREYMRGIYWAHMPEYSMENYFGHDRKLPEWYWSGETKMQCLSHAIRQSLDHAYAHHIQRLMITGNFALLAGIDPAAVDEWYLGIYIDAIEWVEITNTRGMSQFADGGIVGTKPYVSSANYIKKMSHYCKGCHYDPGIKTGEKACPFNSLYWHFYSRNREKLENNPRIGMMYRVFDRMSQEDRESLLRQAENYLESLSSL